MGTRVSLSLRNLAVILIVFAAVTWWILREDPETEVRNAHAELVQLISKTDEETGPALLLRSRALADVFGAPVEISGTAEGLSGVYSPEELGGMIVRMRMLFGAIDLTFSELDVEFPVADVALVEFSAVLVGQPQSAAVEEVVERRNVTSIMEFIDGDWLFTEFELTDIEEN